MKKLNNIMDICISFKEGHFELDEFQSRIISALIPDETSKEFVAALKEFDNQMEMIIFCQGALEGRKNANEAADKLINATMKEQELLKEHSPYKASEKQPPDTSES